jgi:hypothetical protein
MHLIESERAWRTPEVKARWATSFSAALTE